MSTELSPNTQAILLLTAPLTAERYEVAPLRAGEYRQLARRLRGLQREPADLLQTGAGDLLQACCGDIEQRRIEQLLARGFLLSQATQSWSSRAIWVVSRADANYPQQLKKRLGEAAPPVLYGCGDATILDTGGLAVVGSRKVDDALIDYTEEIGRLSAEVLRTVVSGGAAGIGQAVMRGALEAGGCVVGVLAGDLEKEVLIRENRDALMDGHLVFVSPQDPAVRFDQGNAKRRNKLIYALSDVALVMSSDYEKGASWAGAVEQLDTLRFVRVYVRATGATSRGLKALRQRGALPWPDPQTPEDFEDILDAEPLTGADTVPAQQVRRRSASNDDAATHESESGSAPPVQIVDEEPVAPVEPVAQKAAEDVYGRVPAHSPVEVLADTPIEVPEVAEVVEVSAVVAAPTMTPAEELFAKVRDLILCMDTPQTDAQIAAALQVSKTQMRDWLQRLVDEGVVEKLARPVRYRATAKPGSLFDEPA